MPASFHSDFGDVGDGGQALDQGTVSSFSRVKFSFGAMMFDRDTGQMRGPVNQREVMGVRRARLPIITSKGSQHLAVLGGNGHRPAGAQTMS